MILHSDLYHKHVSLSHSHNVGHYHLKNEYIKKTKGRVAWHKPSSGALVSLCLHDESIINMGSSFLLDQSLPGCQSLPVSSPSVVHGCVLETAVPQLSAAGMEAGFEVSAAASEEATSLLVSTESSSMDSVASFTV